MAELVIFAGAVCLLIVAANYNKPLPCARCEGKGTVTVGNEHVLCPVCGGIGGL